jgi:hypothetical protein
MRAKARFTIDVSSTIMKNAAPVATAGIHSEKACAEYGFGTERSRGIALTVCRQDQPVHRPQRRDTTYPAYPISMLP